MYKRVGLFIVILTLITSIIPITVADSNCDFSYSNHARGAQLYDMGDLTSALHHYECALVQNPESDILLLSIGNLYRDMGDITTAQSYYNQVSSTDTSPSVDTHCDFSYSNHARGAQLYGMRDLTSALHHYECALVQNPESDILLLSIGNLYRDMGDITTAQSYYDRMSIQPTTLEADCDTSVSQFALGSQYHAMGDYNRALEAYHCVLDADPEHGAVMVQIAQVYLDTDEFDEALSYLSQALQLDPDNAHLYSQRGYVYFQLEQLQNALLDLNIALDFNPTLKSALETRQLVLQALGQVETLSVAPSSSKYAMPQLDDDTTGNALTMMIAESAPSSPTAETLRQSADAFFEDYEFELAISQYEALLAFEPSNLHVLYRIGHSYYALENPSHALRYLKLAENLDPNHLYTQYFLAMSYSMLDMRHDALSIMSDIFDQYPYDAAFPIAMGHVYRNLGYSDAAGAEFNVWVEGQQLLRIQADIPEDRTPMTLVMDYGVVYEVPFHAIAGETIQISVESDFLNRIPIDPLIVVLNASDIPIDGDDDSGDLFNSYLDFMAPTTGHYTLLVTHAGGRHQGDLNVTLSGMAWSADTFRSLAHYALDDDNYPRAIEMFGKAIALDGGIYQDYMSRAWAYRQLSEFANAISDYYLALELSPYPADVYANIGQIYRLMEDWDSAAIAYSQALEIDPMLDVVRCELGMIYAMWGDYDNALYHFDIILGHNQMDSCAGSNRRATLRTMRELPLPSQPSSADNLLQLARQYYADGKEFTAANTYLDAIKQDPMLEAARCELGAIYTDWSNYLGAMQQFDTVLSHNPNSICATSNREATLLKMENLIIPMTAQDFVRRAEMHESAKEWDKAIESYLIALELNPLRSDARCQLGVVYMMQGDYSDALYHFDIILSQHIMDSCASSNRDTILMTSLKPSIPTQPSPADNLLQLARQYYADGKEFTAANTYLDAIDVDPMLEPARCELGAIFTDWGNYLGAIKQFDIALSHNPTSDCASANRDATFLEMEKFIIPMTAQDFVRQAGIYEFYENWDDATDAYEMALELNPLRSDVRCKLGMVYVIQENYEEALKQFDIVLSQHIMDSCAWSNRDALMQKMREMPVSSGSHFDIDSLEAYSDLFLAQDVYDYPMMDDSPEMSQGKIDALYRELLQSSEEALMQEAEVRHANGEFWVASALLDRYIDEHYPTVCAGELRWLSNEYREKGYSVMADMLYLKAIGDTTC